MLSLAEMTFNTKNFSSTVVNTLFIIPETTFINLEVMNRPYLSRLDGFSTFPQALDSTPCGSKFQVEVRKNSSIVPLQNTSLRLSLGHWSFANGLQCPLCRDDVWIRVFSLPTIEGHLLKKNAWGLS